MSTGNSPAVPSRVYIGTCGVFLGAGIVSLGQRLLATGLPDLRGALGLGFDEAAWIPTAYNMALMFMGPLTVYLGGLLGARRVLLVAGAVFTAASLGLPFAPGLRGVLVLQLVAGLASGTFYPLALGFAVVRLPPRYVIYAVGAYSMELISTLSIGTPLMGWFTEHASWRWIFWTSAVLTPVMVLCVFLAVPPPPKREGPTPRVSWRGFLFLSLGFSLLEGALEQGERLDWFGSGTINAMLIVGAVLLVAGGIQRWWSPNPLVNLAFLAKRNTLILGAGIFTLRFVLLTILVLIPGYLGTVQGYRPEETGRVLLWLAIPTLVMGVVAAQLMKWLDGRLVAAIGLAGVAMACLINAGLNSVWASDQFWWPQLVVASGLAFYFVGEIGLIVEWGSQIGLPANPSNALTFTAYFHLLRLFGGQIGVTVMQRFISVRSTFHSSELAGSVEAGHFLTEERLRALGASLLPSSSGIEESQGRAVASLVGELLRQAYTLASMDGFILVAWVCVGMMILFACMKPITSSFGEAPARSQSPEKSTSRAAMQPAGSSA